MMKINKFFSGGDITIAAPKQKEISPSISNEGFTKALQVFNQVAKRVPAYKDFLKKHQINPEKIKTLVDFQTIPLITKENYLRIYPLKDLLWDGKIDDARVISMSSGSSGQPFYWPRGNQSAKEASELHEIMLNLNFSTKDKETLVIIAFAMGTWIAGTYTLAALIELANRGHKIVTVTPGIDKGAIIRILQNLAPQFEQTIIFGYPPFVKDVIDAAEHEKINLKKLKLKTVFAGENISEQWRDYILDKIKARGNLFATANIYGTADGGLLGNETPVSIYIRRLANKDPKLFRALFPMTSTLPSLIHYFPRARFFEEVDGYLVFTLNNSLPLIRYKILDQGRVISHAQMIATLEKFEYKLPEQIALIPQNGYLAIYGRSDVAAIFYALNVYPENIKYGLEDRHLQKYITGKFVVKTLFDDETQEQSLHLYIELKKRVSPKPLIERKILHSVVKSLKTYNSEYNRLYQELQHKADPIIHLLPHESPDFDIKIKHRWTQ